MGLPRRLQHYLVLLSLVALALLLLYYSRQLGSRGPALLPSGGQGAPAAPTTSPAARPAPAHIHQPVCQQQPLYPADIETSSVFPTLNLEPSWLQRREFWSSQYEDRYQKRKALWPQLPLRVIVMPHSHNDPGWLKTVEGYFATATKNILTNIVNKLTTHSNMTFIWSEVSYLSMWWESADESLRGKLRALLASGRLEMTTGGWIMTDEAVVDLYSMVDQLVEGHAFLRSVLDVRPQTSWSVDSFGHGGAFPHVLSLSGVENLVIMRVHYAWKEWLARRQQGTFRWKQAWQPDGALAPLCLNFPYDIYSIKHSCGPSPHTCLGFDFRHLAGEHNEFTMHYTPINEKNLATRAELLLDQYGRTGSLFPHNVVLVPLGDDFRYSNPLEFDQQYENYMKLMTHINTHHTTYHAHVTFGTLSDYFKEVRGRMKDFSTLAGDFHVYSDIFSEGRPAYWSGYYSTRPAAKLLGRQVAARLRGVELLYAVARAAGPTRSPVARTVLAAQFAQLEAARRALGLFQHHDAITGTSKAFVMRDYEEKLTSALENLNRLEVLLLGYLLLRKEEPISQQQQQQQEVVEDLDDDFDVGRHRLFHLNPYNKADHLQREYVAGEGERVLVFGPNSPEHVILVYNALPHTAQRTGFFRSNAPDVCVYDSRGAPVDSQPVPFYNVTAGRAPRLDLSLFDVWFTVILEPVSVAAFAVRTCDNMGGGLTPTQVYCLKCSSVVDERGDRGGGFKLQPLPPGSLQLENQLYRLLFDEETRLLRTVTNKISGTALPVEISFAAYKSEAFRSGAYLFSAERVGGVKASVPLFSARHLADIVVVTGRVFSEVRVVWQLAGGGGGPATFLHTLRLSQAGGPLSEAVHIENLFDLGPDPSLRDRELFMRLESGVESGAGGSSGFYTDQTGLGFAHRPWSQEADIEGNYFPITEAAFLQDAHQRLSLLVDHATGAASPRPGILEVMVDKRIAYDDGRGMGEGVLDSRPTRHRYVLLLEPAVPAAAEDRRPNTTTTAAARLPALSPLALTLSRQLESPLSILHLLPPLGGQKRSMPEIGLLSAPLPCDYSLVNLRSWGPSQAAGSADALLILRRLAPDCSWSSLTVPDCLQPSTATPFQIANLSAFFAATSLTGNFAQPRPIDRVGGLFDLAPMEIAAYNVTFT